jgi:AGZA family xanthine/uracil permease-like MFS transporter
MAYILALNPSILGNATDINGKLISGAAKCASFVDGKCQIDQAAVSHSIVMVAAATGLVAGVLTILMGVIGRFPIGMASGLGLNALVAYTIAPMMTWKAAMGLVVWEGIIITILVFTGFREAVFRAVPPQMRTAISVGIGLFIAFVGLVNAGIVRPGSGTITSLGIDTSLGSWPMMIFIIGLFLMIFLYIRKVKGSILIAVIATTVLAVIVQAIGHLPTQADGTATGWTSNAPAMSGSWSLPDLGLLGNFNMLDGFKHFACTTALDASGACATGYAATGVTAGSMMTGIMLVFSLMLADFFDTVGTVVAVGSEGGMLNEQGEPPHLREVLLVDSLGAVGGGMGSVSSCTSYIESTAGVADGARTGLGSVVTGAAFLVAMFISPVISFVPAEAVAPALVLVGFLMITQVTQIHWDDFENAIPAYIAIILMPFGYSITVGIGAGFISYALLKVFRGKAKHVHPLMWVVAALFVIYFAQGPLNDWISSIS